MCIRDRLEVEIGLLERRELFVLLERAREDARCSHAALDAAQAAHAALAKELQSVEAWALHVSPTFASQRPKHASPPTLLGSGSIMGLD